MTYNKQINRRKCTKFITDVYAGVPYMRLKTYWAVEAYLHVGQSRRCGQGLGFQRRNRQFTGNPERAEPVANKCLLGKPGTVGGG